ncbi:helix-turn-helix transcriptional regulator [Alloprevotella tannerae]
MTETLSDAEKFKKQLRLIVLLTTNAPLSVDEISRQLHMSRRSTYRYIEELRKAGFILKKSGTRYFIDHHSPFFTQVTQFVHFTDDEAVTMNQILNTIYDDSPRIRHLREKLARYYDVNFIARVETDELLAKNLSVLYEGVQTERVCILHDYYSPNSKQTSDRIVEPFLFLNGNNEVRCYELATGTNKTFKISRARSVELLDLQWSHKDRHAAFYTDLFHFSGERLWRVKLILGPLAADLLVQSAPKAKDLMVVLDDGRYFLETEVCSLKGVGRFVLGLYDDIDVFDSPELEEYLAFRIKDMQQKNSKGRSVTPTMQMEIQRTIEQTQEAEDVADNT